MIFGNFIIWSKICSPIIQNVPRHRRPCRHVFSGLAEAQFNQTNEEFKQIIESIEKTEEVYDTPAKCDSKPKVVYSTTGKQGCARGEGSYPKCKTQVFHSPKKVQPVPCVKIPIPQQQLHKAVDHSDSSIDLTELPLAPSIINIKPQPPASTAKDAKVLCYSGPVESQKTIPLKFSDMMSLNVAPNPKSPQEGWLTDNLVQYCLSTILATCPLSVKSSVEIMTTDFFTKLATTPNTSNLLVFPICQYGHFYSIVAAELKSTRPLLRAEKSCDPCNPGLGNAQGNLGSFVGFWDMSQFPHFLDHFQAECGEHLG